MEKSLSKLICKCCLCSYASMANIPKIIQCGHSICDSCVNKMISCPLQINKCPTCERELDKEKLSTSATNYELLEIVKKENKSCIIHYSEKLNFYCQTDNVMICQYCLLNHHLNHQIVRPQESPISKLLSNLVEFELIAQKAHELNLDHSERINDIYHNIDQAFSEIYKYTHEIKNLIKFKFYSDFKHIKIILDDLQSMEEIFTNQYEELKKGKDFSEDILNNLNQELSIIKSKYDLIPHFTEDLTKDQNCQNALSLLLSMKSLSDDLKSSLQNEELFQKYEDIENAMEYLIRNKVSEIRYSVHSSQEHINLISIVKDSFSDDEKPKENTINVLNSIDRSDFVANNFLSDEKYSDTPLPIGWNTTISAPHMHMITLNFLSKHCEDFNFPPDAKAIDIGCGSGYFTLALSKLLGPMSTTIALDHIDEIVDFARGNISKRHKRYITSDRIKFVCCDGKYGYSKGGPYHIIHIGAACVDMPQEIIDQLIPGGVMWIPIGPRRSTKMIYLVTKDREQKVTRTAVIPVSYAEMQSKEEQLNEVEDDEDDFSDDAI